MIPNHHLARATALLIMPLLISAVQLPAQGPLTRGLVFKAFYWTMDSDSSVKSGCYGYTKIDSAAQIPEGTRYSSSFWLPTYSWWHRLFTQTYLSTAIRITESKPAAVTRSPGHFSNVPWLEGFERTDSAGNAMRFLFPMLPITSSYGRYDYFTVDVNDTVDLEFYGAGDSIVVGTFVDKRPGPTGAIRIIARNAFVVELTNSNPVRIGSVRCNGSFEPLVSSYLGYDLKKLKQTAAWYGFDIMDTSSNVPKISIHSVDIREESPITAGSTCRITWTLEGAAGIDSCLVSVSFDSAKTWIPAGKTLVDSSYLWTVPPNRETQNAFLRITACGKNGERISSQSSRFSTVIKDDFILSVTSYSGSSIIASWNPSSITVPRKKAFCLAWRSGSIVRSFDETTDFDTVMHGFTVSRDTIAGLEESGVYYFSAFVLDSSGSLVLIGPGGIDSALAKDLTPPLNSAILTGSAIDSSSIVLTWRFSGQRDPDIDTIMLRRNEFRFPLSVNDVDSRTVPLSKSSDTIVTVTGLKPGTTWYFALFVADSLGNWSDADTQSMVQIRTPTGGMSTDDIQVVRISGGDTQKVFLDTIRLWSTDLKTAYTDTIDPWTAPPLSGFLHAGPSFSFRYGMLPRGVTLSMTIKPGKPPENYTISDLRVYRYNIFTGGWRIEENAPVIDPEQGTITFTTNDARLPFIVMVDTVPPETGPARPDTSVYRVTQPIVDTFAVDDNIENPSLRLLAAPGSLGYSDISLYVVPGRKEGTYITSIPPYVADMQSGIRGLFSVSDGRNSVGVNISRRILRTNGNVDNIVAQKMAWAPIFVTAQPLKPELQHVMDSANGEIWNYDKKKERIIRWLPMENDSSSTERWVEYGPEIDSLFSFSPGRLYWIKHGKGMNFDYGDAVIPALLDTFELTLKHGEWTDFTLPYRFDIYSGDLLSATETKRKNAADSIELYRWVESDTSYATDPLFLPGIAELTSDTIRVPCARPLTAYNASGKDMLLRIPPVCTPISEIPPRAISKKTERGAWSVKISVRDKKGGLLPSIYCARTPSNGRNRYYPMPPAFSALSAGIVDESTGKRFGSAAAGELSQGGTTFRIVFENGGKTHRTIVSHVETLYGLPDGMQASLLLSEGNQAGKPLDRFETALAPGGKAFGYLAVGTADYIGRTVVALTSRLSFRPYSLNGALALHYTLPAGARTMTIELFDLKGRKTDFMRRTAGLSPGANSLVWRTLQPAGYYIVRMSVEVNGKEKPLVMSRRWLYVR